MLSSLKKPKPRNHNFKDLRDSEYIIIKFPETEKRWDPGCVPLVLTLTVSPEVGTAMYHWYSDCRTPENVSEGRLWVLINVEVILLLKTIRKPGEMFFKSQRQQKADQDLIKSRTRQNLTGIKGQN